MIRFELLVKQLLRLKEENSDRLNQQILSNRCGTILKSADYIQKRRLAVASGELILIIICCVLLAIWFYTLLGVQV